MSVWVYVVLFVLGTTTLILGLAAFFNFSVTAYAHRRASKIMDNHIVMLARLLPGKNCGACGCDTCEEYARGIFSCRMESNLCSQGDSELPDKLNKCMDEFQRILDGEKPR